jgi:hypothetical protein
MFATHGTAVRSEPLTGGEALISRVEVRTTHLAFHAGWPDAMNAANVAEDIFAKRAV